MAPPQRRLAAALLGSLFLSLVPATTGAQEEGGTRLELTGQPVWHGPKDDLDLRLRVFNDSGVALEGFIVTVAAHSRVLSRSELHESFAGAPTFEASRITADLPGDGRVPPGESLEFTLDQPVADLQSLAGATESGVYPLTVSLFDAAGRQMLDSLTTPLIYYPSPPDLPLNAALVLPINDLPRRGPDGIFAPDATTGRSALQVALAEGGWLDGVVDAIEATTAPPAPRETRPRRSGRRGRGGPLRTPAPQPPDPLQVGIALTPRLIEEIADMANGYRRTREGDLETVRPGSDDAIAARRFLDRLEALLAAPPVQPLLVPYAFPDLPARPDQAGPQLFEGEAVLTEHLDIEPDRSWVFPPGGRLDENSLEELQLATAASRSFFTASSLEPLTDPAGGGCPDPVLSFTCPITVSTAVASTNGYALDSDLQRRVTDLIDAQEPRLMLQRFFAETATIREELPGSPGRVIPVVLPALWTPPPWVARVLLQGLHKAPWLKTVTPAEGLQATGSVEARPRTLRSPIGKLEGAPGREYFESIEEAQTSVETLKGIEPPAALLERLTRNTLVAESRSWWSAGSLDEGIEYAEETAEEAQAELDKITIGDTDEIGLTSRTAPVQVTIFNDADYPARVNVHVSSPELNVERTFSETVRARGLSQVKFDVVAETSGIFALEVELQTPEGADIGERQVISIRSTEFNEIALGLTFGALAFLVLFYVTRGARRRRVSEEDGGARA